MEKIGLTAARRTLPDLAARASYGGERFIITRHGRDDVALIPIADLRALEAFEAGSKGKPKGRK